MRLVVLNEDFRIFFPGDLLPGDVLVLQDREADERENQPEFQGGRFRVRYREFVEIQQGCADAYGYIERLGATEANDSRLRAKKNDPFSGDPKLTPETAKKKPASRGRRRR